MISIDNTNTPIRMVPPDSGYGEQIFKDVGYIASVLCLYVSNAQYVNRVFGGLFIV